MKDDRQEFEDSKCQFAKKMAVDSELQQKSRELYALADRHNFPYLWNWMGVPIIQSPCDILTMQEIIWKSKPDVLIETGVARGGSVIMAASLLALIGKGEVIGIDIEIRPHNRDSIAKSPVRDRITLIEGSSTDEKTFQLVKQRLPENAKVMVVLDSNHTHDHVLQELHLYAPLVTKGQYLVVADTCIEDLPTVDVRGKRPWGKGNSPKSAMDLYMKECSRFKLDELINNKLLLTQSPNGYFIAD